MNKSLNESRGMSIGQLLLFKSRKPIHAYTLTPTHYGHYTTDFACSCVLLIRNFLMEYFENDAFSNTGTYLYNVPFEISNTFINFPQVIHKHPVYIYRN